MNELSAITALQVWALVPIKESTLAKTRLSGLLASEERACLQRAMLQDVLDQLSQVKWLSGIAVISPDAHVRHMVQIRGMLAINDEPERGGLNEALRFGSQQLIREGADLIIILPGDVPTLDPAEIDHAIDVAMAEDTAVIVPDCDRQGTNAFVFWANCVPAFRFGKDSFSHHLDAMSDHRVKSLTLASIANDIDCPGDLYHLCSRHASGSARRTIFALTEFGLRHFPEQERKDNDHSGSAK